MDGSHVFSFVFISLVHEHFGIFLCVCVSVQMFFNGEAEGFVLGALPARLLACSVLQP